MLLLPLLHGPSGPLDEIVAVIGSLILLYIVIRLIFFERQDGDPPDAKPPAPQE